MLLLVGLGNPGSKYSNNRHNIGYLALDAIVENCSFGSFSKKFHGRIADGSINGEKVLALKPETFMNESGRSVSAACKFFKISSEQVLVLHDEIDLAPSKVRVKRGGGHAGHNGLRSIHEHIGPNYGRVRLGIGHPGKQELVIGHVLKDFSKTDEKWVNKVISSISKNVVLLVSECDREFMNKVAAEVSSSKIKKMGDDYGL